MFSISIYCDTYKNVHHKRVCYDGNFYFWFPHKFPYSGNKNLSFHLPQVHIIGNNHCVNTLREAFKRRNANQFLLSRRDYYERWLSSSAHQIQSEYYGGNRSVSIEYIVLEHFSARTHIETEGTPQARTRHAVFHSFF